MKKIFFFNSEEILCEIVDFPDPSGPTSTINLPFLELLKLVIDA